MREGLQVGSEGITGWIRRLKVNRMDCMKDWRLTGGIIKGLHGIISCCVYQRWNIRGTSVLSGGTSIVLCFRDIVTF